MVVLLKKNAPQQQLDSLTAWLQSMGITPHISVGSQQTIVGLVGDTSKVDMDVIRAMDIVEDVKRIQEPFKNANRKFHPEDTVIEVGGARIGGGNFCVMAGPCSVESEEQIVAVAKAVKQSGAQVLRGGAFKPRTSPYAFQGLQGDGIKLLLLAKQETGLPIVSEIMDASHIPLFEDVDIIQVGARNMQNFDPAERAGQAAQAGAAQAGPGQHPPGAADERRIHHGRGQRAGHPLRAGHPHL